MARFILPDPPMLRIQAEALTFDDVSLVPAHSTVLPKDVSLATRLTRDLRLNLPIVSAAMDTVTEARLAITMAQEGGIGIVHKNMTIEQPGRAKSRAVKKFETGVIRDPFTVGPDTTIARSARAHPRAQHLRRAGGATAASWSASSPAATCASRRSSTRRSATS